MSEIEAILRVLVVGLVLGAGLPALFAVGMRIWSTGDSATADGTVTERSNPVYRIVAYAVFALIAMLIAVAILWIAKGTIKYYFDVNLFPFIHSK